MKTKEYTPYVLNDSEAFELLKGFCYEALRFLDIPRSSYPTFFINGRIGLVGRSFSVYIDYKSAIIHVNIPLFKNLIRSKNVPKGGEGPTIYRKLGYQIARFWYRFIKYNVQDDFDFLDEDSWVFSDVLLTLKGIYAIKHPNLNKSLEMLRNEFHIECEKKTAYNKSENRVSDIIGYTKKELEKRIRSREKLYTENLNRPLESINEDQLGSESNPFLNVDDAANYILNLEKERLLTDPYRQAIANEQYFYNGATFHILWASANVSYYPIENDKNFKFVANQLTTHNKYALKPTLANRKFLFRGQSQFYSPCKPNLFRSNKDYFVDDIIYTNELECLLKTHPLVKLFEEGFVLLNDFFRFKINYSGLSQHYYNKTPLLDLTSDIDVAKFFAVTTFNAEMDRYEKYTGEKLGVLYFYDLKANSFSAFNNCHLIDNIGKQPFMRSGNQSGFLIPLDKDDDFNENPNVRYVFFRHNQEITDRIFSQFDNGDKLMPIEILRNHWLSKLQGPESKIISQNTLKLNFSHNPQESHRKIVKALQEKGFKIKNYIPSFTKEELDAYYESALDFWEDFCSDIYFYGPEGILYKELLRNLPQDQRYKWAFVR